MRYIVDTERLTITPLDETSEKKTLADIMTPWIGTKEYDGVIAEIQNWYYGRLVKDAWCATAVSYAAHLLGGEIEKIVGKYENVDSMKKHLVNQNRLDCTKNYGGGAYKPVRGDLVFFSAVHNYKDCTHVGVILTADNKTGYLETVSGNASDMVKRDTYNYLNDRYVVAFGNIQV